MSEIAMETYLVNGIQMRAAIAGSGPLVILVHGFPEGWVSWRSQLHAISAAGYRAVAPDMRGYGGTEAPNDASVYTQLHLVGDLVALVAALGDTKAVIIGHDWGAPVAWNAALMRPDMFHAVVGLSVPFAPSGSMDMLTALEKLGVQNFYIQYFQTPGVAEAELEADVASSMRRITFGLSAEGATGMAGVLQPGKSFLDGTPEPKSLPPWVIQADLEYTINEFQRTGFRGGLNWYRAIRLSWELMAPWRGAIIHQPSLFIGGSKDDVLKFPNSRASIKNFSRTLPGLRGCHILEGVGHWIQREKTDDVNKLLVEFLSGL